MDVRRLWLILLSGCDAASTECEAAMQHVSDCYGADVAESFAASCDAETAAAALADECEAPEGVDGKADFFPTQILSPALEQFKYGSIGGDKRGLPLSILRALPIVCEDLLPEGADPYNEPLAAFGLIYEPGRALPIGFSSRRLPIVGTTLTGNTCSVCHTSTVRETPDSERMIYFGAPATRFDIEAYNDFLLGCITDPSRFNSSRLSAAFRELGITGPDRFLTLVTSFVRAFVADLDTKIDSVVRDGPWGPGRDDAIGLSGAILLGPEFVPSIPAPVDFPAVWNQDARRGQSLHWDGAAGSALERNVLVSVGAGTPRNGVPIESVNAIQSWLEALEVPAYPFEIDEGLAARGAPIFEERCASCHAEGGAQLWAVIDVAELGTDPNRVEVITEEAIDEINSLSGTGWRFDTFRKTNGYLSGLLDGIWLRAPYLHNGSVPTLRDLLRPSAERPATFYRGNDTYDQANVGFVAGVPREGNAPYSLFDTSLAGNDNGGHEYGTDLSDADVDALLEYLKTL